MKDLKNNIEQTCKELEDNSDIISFENLENYGFKVQIDDSDNNTFVYFTHPSTFLNINAEKVDGSWEIQLYNESDKCFTTKSDDVLQYILTAIRYLEQAEDEMKEYRPKLSPSEKMAEDIKWCEETLLKPKHTTRTGGLSQDTGPRN